MLKFLVLFVLFALVSSSVYDFKDGSFNEQLIFENYKELIEQLDEQQSLRFHRDIKEHKNDSREWKKELRDIKCCNSKINSKPDYYLRELELRKECLNKIKSDNFIPKLVCNIECIARKLAFIDENGDIIRDVFVEIMKTKYINYGPQWKLDVCEEMIDKCLAEIKSYELSIEFISSNSVARKCNPTALKLEHCLWYENIRSCPKDLQVDSPKCIKLRKNVENSDNSISKSVYFRYMS